MVTTVFGDPVSRSVPTRNIPRYAVARLVTAPEFPARRQVNIFALGLDHGTLASLGYDRPTLERAGAGPFPL
jgi:hypothetical protein